MIRPRKPQDDQWCPECRKFRHYNHFKSNAGRGHDKPPQEPKDFFEYAALRLADMSIQARDNFDIHPEQFNMMRAFWHVQWLESKGFYDAANAERFSLASVLSSTRPAPTAELVSA